MGKTPDEVAAGLAELFNGRKGPGPHNRYVLRSNEAGEVFFELDEIDLMFPDLFWPEDPPTPRFVLDPKIALLRYQ
jgi:hypothetical protein